jgi:hypothetical protein
MDLKKKTDEEKDEEKKALSAGSDAGRALSPESLEGKVTDLGYGRSVSKSLSFQECVDLLCEHRRLSIPDATAVTEAVFVMNGISHI